MGLRDFMRSLAPGNDAQLANDLRTQQRIQRSRSAAKADREGQKWERKDRARDRRGDRHTDWRN